MPQQTRQTTEQIQDPYAGTAMSAQSFLDAIHAFQQSTDPNDVALREAASEMLIQMDNDE